MRKRTLNRSLAAYAALLALILIAGSCLPKPTTETGGLNITLYGFSIMKESLEKAIYPGFAAKWKQEHGEDVHFTSSFAGSETVTNQILQGVPADIAILSIDRDAERLKDGGFVTSDWRALPYKGIVNKTPFVILVKGANPKGIHDFPDLAKPAGIGRDRRHPDRGCQPTEPQDDAGHSGRPRSLPAGAQGQSRGDAVRVNDCETLFGKV